jgi:hypothetical protein
LEPKLNKDTKVSKGWIERLILDFFATAPENSMQNGTLEPAWDSALVGFASGAD